MTESQQLLAEYARNGSDAAFRELVSRYVDLVYSTALRLVEGDTHRAEDVVQTVFVDLARVARTLPAEVKLGGWLHRDTCFAAAALMRGERRRKDRERRAVEMNALQNHPETDFSQVAPLLDEAINELGEADRIAILLRFFEQQDFRAVGQALGSTEDAARMRVTRALEKLEEFLRRRGATTTAASLGLVLTANAVHAAPVGLAVAIATTAALAGTTVATTATATAFKTIAMTTLQTTMIGATLAAVLGAGIYEARQAGQLREQNQTLQQQQAPLAEQIQQLTKDRDETTRQLAAFRDDNERLTRNTAELLKLRGEIGLLRREMNSNVANNGARPLSEWLQEYDSKAGDLKPEAQDAIRQMGTNSIPELLSILHSSSSGDLLWRVTCAFKALGPKAKAAVPALLEILQNSAPVDMRLQAASSLGFVGPDAQAAIPALIAALGDKENIPVRMNSIGALNRIGGDSSVLVPVFTASLDDPFWDVRVWAATGLGKFGSQAESAVPKLLEALGKTDDEAMVLVALTKALETIGPTTNNAIPVLLKLLSHPNDGVRTGATNALIRIDPAAATHAQVK